MPTKHKDERPVVVHPETGSVATKKISEHRRKIIKASAAAVPAIMTLRSGAAAAMTSINQCITDDAKNGYSIPENKKVWGDSSDERLGALDEWARVKGKKVTKGQSTYYCVQNMSGAWECYDSDGRRPPGDSLHDDEIERDGMDVYLLAYVDTVSGGYTWYPQRVLVVKDQAASPITGSCLTSMNPDVDLV